MKFKKRNNRARWDHPQNVWLREASEPSTQQHKYSNCVIKPVGLRFSEDGPEQDFGDWGKAGERSYAAVGSKVRYETGWTVK